MYSFQKFEFKSFKTVWPGETFPKMSESYPCTLFFSFFFCENYQFKRVLAIRDRISIKNHEIFFKDKIFKKGEVHFPHALEGGSSFIEEQV